MSRSRSDAHVKVQNVQHAGEPAHEAHQEPRAPRDMNRLHPDDEAATRGEVNNLQRRPLSGARLGAYTAIGAAASGVPLPWLPDLMLGRVRGALLHDIAAKCGLALTPGARDILVEGDKTDKPTLSRRALGTAARFATRAVLSRIGPLAVLPPLRGALGTFALGHLFHRYVDGMRRERSVRMDETEALRVRRAIDQALFRVVTDDPRGASLFLDAAPEELRDGTTKFVDGVLMTIASLPEWLTARLDAAFDDAMVSMTTPSRNRASVPPSATGATGGRG